MKKELASALNDQMVFELYSSYIYLGLTACLEKMKLPGAAHWMRIQVDEEIIHAGIFYNYLNDQSEDIVLDTIKKPELGKIRTPLDAFKEALKHEKLVTARINKLVELSIKSGGYATMAFLNFFVTEQVQEERSVQTIIDKLERAGSDEKALLFIDAELQTRPGGNASGGGTDHVTQETLRKQGCKGRFFLLCIFFYSRFLTVPDFEQVHEFDKKQ